MTAITLLLSAILCASSAPTREVFEFRFSDRIITSITATPDGPVIVGYWDEEREENQTVIHSFRPYVAKLTRGGVIQWEYKSVKQKVPPLHAVEYDNGFIYAFGNTYTEENGTAYLLKLDMAGKVIRKQNLPVAGYVTTEGKHIFPLGDGRIVLGIEIFQNHNSYEQLMLMCLDADGNTLWQRHLFNNGNLMVQAFCGRVTHDGNLVLSGRVWQTVENVRNSIGTGWMCKIATDKQGATLWDHFFTDYVNFGLNSIAEGSDGSLVATGSFEADNQRHDMVHVTSADGKTSWEMIVNDKTRNFSSIMKDQAGNHFHAAGYNEKKKYILTEITPEGEIMNETVSVGEGQTLKSQMAPDGTVYSATRTSVIMVR